MKTEAKLENPMRQIKMEKVILSAGATGDDLIKAKKLLEIVSGRKAQILASSKRIPEFDVRPGLEVGTRVTLRGKEALDILKRLLSAIANELKSKQVSDNHFSFGVKEYIEIPGMEYQRDLDVIGLDVAVVFKRAGRTENRGFYARVSGALQKVQSFPRSQSFNECELC